MHWYWPDNRSSPVPCSMDLHGVGRSYIHDTYPSTHGFARPMARSNALDVPTRMTPMDSKDAGSPTSSEDEDAEEVHGILVLREVRVCDGERESPKAD